jgi:hypothetical protein
MHMNSTMGESESAKIHSNFIQDINTCICIYWSSILLLALNPLLKTPSKIS